MRHGASREVTCLAWPRSWVVHARARSCKRGSKSRCKLALSFAGAKLYFAVASSRAKSFKRNCPSGSFNTAQIVSGWPVAH
jgi:hypothetical protein